MGFIQARKFPLCFHVSFIAFIILFMFGRHLVSKLPGICYRNVILSLIIVYTILLMFFLWSDITFTIGSWVSVGTLDITINL